MLVVSITGRLSPRLRSLIGAVVLYALLSRNTARGQGSATGAENSPFVLDSVLHSLKDSLGLGIARAAQSTSALRLLDDMQAAINQAGYGHLINIKAEKASNKAIESDLKADAKREARTIRILVLGKLPLLLNSWS